jgi:hypothetical protein
MVKIKAIWVWRSVLLQVWVNVFEKSATSNFTLGRRQQTSSECWDLASKKYDVTPKKTAAARVSYLQLHIKQGREAGVVKTLPTRTSIWNLN